MDRKELFHAFLCEDFLPKRNNIFPEVSIVKLKYIFFNGVDDIAFSSCMLHENGEMPKLDSF